MIFRHGQNDSDRIGRQTSSMLSFFWRRGASVKFAFCFRKEPTLFLGRQRRRFPKIELYLGWDKFFLPLFPALPLFPPPHTHTHTNKHAARQAIKETKRINRLPRKKAVRPNRRRKMRSKLDRARSLGLVGAPFACAIGRLISPDPSFFSSARRGFCRRRQLGRRCFSMPSIRCRNEAAWPFCRHLLR